MFTILANDNLIYSPDDRQLALSQPKLTMELGKAGSLEFHVPPTHPYYELLGRLSTKVSVLQDDEELFRGRVLSNEREFHNIRSVFCEGDLAYLVDSVQRAEKYIGKTHDLFSRFIAVHNARMGAGSDKLFTVGRVTVENRDIILTGQDDDAETDVTSDNFDYRQIVVNSVVDNWNTTFDIIQNSIIDFEGGYLSTSRVGGVTYINLLAPENGTEIQQEIAINVNLLDLKESVSPEDLFTVLIPIGDDNLTISSVNHGSDELVDSAAVAQYGRIVRTQVFSNVTSAATLLENGQRYLQSNVNIPRTFTIQAVDLHLLNPDIPSIHVGDRVRINSVPHGLSEAMTCTKIEYDLASPANNVYTFGNPKQTLTDRYREDKRLTENTYGTGGTGAGVTGAAKHDWHVVGDVVDNAKEEVSSEVDEKFEDFFDAWINVDASQGTVSLGGVYRDIENYKTVLENNVGINLDAPAGTIDIFADHSTWAQDRITLNQRCGINLDAPAGTINIYTVAATADQADSRAASIIAWAGVDAQGHIGSNIALNADLVTVSNRLQAVEGAFDRLTSDTAYFSKSINTPQVYSNTYNINGARVVVNQHQHTISVADDGTVSIGQPDWVGNQQHSFNIADTKKYKDGVSARTASSVVYDTQVDYQTGQTNRNFDVAVVTSADGHVKRVTIPKMQYQGNYYNAYDLGYLNGSGSVTQRTATAVDYERDDRGDVVWDQVAIYYDTGGITSLPIYNAYEAGQRSVVQRTATSVDYERDDRGDVVWDQVAIYYDTGAITSLPIYNAYEAGRQSVVQRTATSLSYAVDEQGGWDYSRVIVSYNSGQPTQLSITNAYTLGWNAAWNIAYTAGFNAKTVYSVSFAVRSRPDGSSYWDYGYIWVTFNDGSRTEHAISENAYNTGWNAAVNATRASISVSDPYWSQHYPGHTEVTFTATATVSGNAVHSVTRWFAYDPIV